MTATNWSIGNNYYANGGTWISNSSAWNGAIAKNAVGLGLGDEAVFKLTLGKTGAMYFGLDDDLTVVSGTNDEPKFNMYLDYGAQGTLECYVDDTLCNSISTPNTGALIKFKIEGSDGTNVNNTVKVYFDDVYQFSYPYPAGGLLYQTVTGVATAEVQDCTYVSSVVDQKIQVWFHPTNNLQDVNNTVKVFFYPEGNVQDVASGGGGETSSSSAFKWWIGMRGKRRYGNKAITRIRL